MSELHPPAAAPRQIVGPVGLERVAQIEDMRTVDERLIAKRHVRDGRRRRIRVPIRGGLAVGVIGRHREAARSVPLAILQLQSVVA